MTNAMHLGGATYHAVVPRPCEHPPPADVSAQIRPYLPKTRAGGAAFLRPRELISGLKAEGGGGSAAAGMAQWSPHEAAHMPSCDTHGQTFARPRGDRTTGRELPTNQRQLL
jgi:hypothetical protein